MPSAPLKPCSTQGCAALVEVGRCKLHQSQQRREADERRGNSSERGYGARWRKAREGWLRAHPLCACEQCQEGKLRMRMATVVDHIVPHRLDEARASGDASAQQRAMSLFWDTSNWQSMHKECHDRKTAKEDGGFGRS